MVVGLSSVHKTFSSIFSSRSERAEKEEESKNMQFVHAGVCVCKRRELKQDNKLEANLNYRKLVK